MIDYGRWVILPDFHPEILLLCCCQQPGRMNKLGWHGGKLRQIALDESTFSIEAL